MKAVIMAGGEGTRLRPVGIPLPKPMMPLFGRPVMEHIVELLRCSGIDSICATLRYKPQVITDYFGDGSRFGVKMEYRIETEPLGTAGGVRSCLDFAEGEDFLVISGDAACDFDLRSLIKTHERFSPDATLALYPCSSPLQYGLVLTDAIGRVISFIEKPIWRRVVTDMVNTGIYIVSPGIFSKLEPGTPCDFGKELFPRLLERGGKLRASVMDGYWCDIGTPEAYFQCNLDALSGKLHLSPPDIPRSGSSSEARHEPPTSPSAYRRSIPCNDRAMLMRLLSSYMMEAGADFSNGLSLSTPYGNVHISPSAENSSLDIDVDCPSFKDAKRLADEYSGIAERLRDSFKP